MRHTGIHNTLICRSGQRICNGEGYENKEHGMIYNEQTNMVAAWKIGKQFQPSYKYSSIIELTQEVCYYSNIIISAQSNYCIKYAVV